MKISDRIYKDILQGISNGKFEFDSYLPTEQSFTQDYGVSRTAVRAALLKLREEGYIKSRQGSGSIVCKIVNERPPFFIPVENLEDLVKCYECRASLEPAIAAKAAQLRTDEDIEFFEEHLNELETSVAEGVFSTKPDTDFHLRLARISGNKYFEQIMQSLQPHVILSMNMFHNLPPNSVAHVATMALKEHTEIIAKIREGDSDEAFRAMENHILKAKTRIS